MNSVSRHVMQELDRKAVEEYGIPSLLLMENAGLACAHEVLKMDPQGEVLIFAGKGNNGGDGFVLARHLHNHGVAVRCVYFQAVDAMKPDPQINFKILEKLSVPMLDCSAALKKSILEGTIQQAALIVDAMFGTGLTRPIEKPMAELIEQLNTSGKPILAVDIPSGLDADSGRVLGIAIRAKRTVTFGLAKQGCLKEIAQPYCGQLIVANISLPRHLIDGASKGKIT